MARAGLPRVGTVRVACRTCLALQSRSDGGVRGSGDRGVQISKEGGDWRRKRGEVENHQPANCACTSKLGPHKQPKEKEARMIKTVSIQSIPYILLRGLGYIVSVRARAHNEPSAGCTPTQRAPCNAMQCNAGGPLRSLFHYQAPPPGNLCALGRPAAFRMGVALLAHFPAFPVSCGGAAFYARQITYAKTSAQLCIYGLKRLATEFPHRSLEDRERGCQKRANEVGDYLCVSVR